MPDSTWTGLSARGFCFGTQSNWYFTLLQATFRDTGSGWEKPEHPDEQLLPCKNGYHPPASDLGCLTCLEHVHFGVYFQSVQ